MEPAAPGTEDDVLVIPSNLKKKENEQSRLLSIKAKLPNGKYGNVFEHSIISGSDHWYCNICECPIMGRIYHHEVGKRHRSNLHSTGTFTEPPPDADIDDEEPEPPLFIAPGEPVPPGFENNVEKVAAVQERLDNFKVEPLVGLEYLFELTEYDLEKEPSYLCSLCVKRGDPRTVIAHLASYNHIIKYLQLHFGKCYRALAPYITKQYKRNWHATMQKIAEAIETKYGRLKPHVVDKEVFEKKRSAYHSMVLKGPHFHERPGATFEEFVVKEELTKLIEDDDKTIKQAEEAVKRNYRETGGALVENSKRSPSPPVVAKPKKPKAAVAGGEKRKSLSSVSSISSSDLSDFDPGKEALPMKRKSKQQPKLDDADKSRPSSKKSRPSPAREARIESRGRSRSRSRERYERRVLPWQRSDYRSRKESSTVNREKPKVDKQAEFKKLATAIERDMDRVFKQHEKNPEKHPQYNDEWKKFWNQRYKELQAEGKNPAGHDFKPEWIEYWNNRLKEMHAIEVKSKKDALRKRLGLYDEPAPICFRITGKQKPSHKDESGDSTKLTPMASAPDQDPDVIIIDDKDGMEIKDTIKKRSRSPWERDTSHISHRSPERRSNSRDRQRARNHARSRSRGRRSRSRDREIDRPSRSSYHDYPREPMYYREYSHDYIKPPRVMRDVTRHPVSSPPPIHRLPKPEPEDDGEVNIVSVLRLLTALEEKLGSLGPKIIDLLSQALAMEKNEANSSETLLDNDMNCVMFETVKEKLKGQLLAGLVNHAQEKAFKVAIKKIASLIHAAGERKSRKDKEKPKMDPIKVPGVGAVDKAAIAKQIAAALITQGKTDVTQAELEQLINAVVGMAEASQTSSKPMTTASFLQQLSQSKPVESVEPSAASLKNVLQAEPNSTVTPTNSMEGLSDSDLQTLLQNFKDLCTDEQHSLISYLKKLEAREPERVERLRKFVNLEVQGAPIERDNDALFEKSDEETSGKVSPFAGRTAGTNPISDDTSRNKNEYDKPRIIEKVTIDSDDEDYTFEDVFKAANKNILEKEEKEEKERLAKSSASVFKNEDFDLSNAKSLFANIMGQFRSKTETPQVSQITNPIKPFVPPPKPPSVPMPANFPNPGLLDSIPINIANITTALNTAHKIKPHMPQIQLPISNPNSFSLQPASNVNNVNPNTNNFSFQPHSQQNSSLPQKEPLLGSSTGYSQRFGGSSFEPPNLRFEQNHQHRERGDPNFDSQNVRFEPPPHLQKKIPPLLGSNKQPRPNFNRQMQPDRVGRRPEYFDNRW